MARPQILQELKHDKLLTKSNFPFFVDSWNYVSNRIENIRGDADLVAQYGCGHITVDNTDPEHPIIRCVNLPKGEGGSVDVDTDVAQNPDSNSIQRRTESYGEFIQLLDFNGDNRKTPCELGSATDFLIREKTTGSSGTTINLDYIAKEYVINPLPDTREGTQCSIEERGSYGSQNLWQLYKFHDQSQQINLGCLGSSDWFVIRHDKKVDYVPANDLKVIPDHDIGCTHSIEGCGTSPKEIRLYNWLGCGCVFGAPSYFPTLWDLCAPSSLGGCACDVLVRRNSDKTLEYMDLRNLARFADADMDNATTQSIQGCVEGGKVKFMLYDFNAPTAETQNIELKYDGCAYHLTNGSKTPENKQLLVRNGLTKELEYWDFTITAPKIGCGDVDQGLWDEIHQSHCDCGSKWAAYYDWKDDIDEMLGCGSGAGCFWKTGGSADTCNATNARIDNQLDIGGNSNLTSMGWTCGGALTVNGIGSFSTVYVNQGLGVTGSATFSNDITVDGNHDITIGSTSISSGCALFDGSVQVGSSTYISGGCASIGCATISDSYTYLHSQVHCGGGVQIPSNKTLAIGSTTLNEAQLQQLLRLI